MDRFIAADTENAYKSVSVLKSNMDRFIAMQTLIDIQQYFFLKSNMDRFIAGGTEKCSSRT